MIATKLEVALVGFTGSGIDICMFAEFLDSVGPDTPIDATGIDPIDLNYGRDFLAEDKEYDFVLLMFLFLPDVSNSNEAFDMFGHECFRVSPLQTAENWRERLLKTKAHKIFMFTGHENSEISGDFIGKIPGYKSRKFATRAGCRWEYTREN